MSPRPGTSAGPGSSVLWIRPPIAKLWPLPELHRGLGPPRGQRRDVEAVEHLTAPWSLSSLTSGRTFRLMRLAQHRRREGEADAELLELDR